MQTRGNSDGPLTTVRLGSHERDQRGADQVPVTAEVRKHPAFFVSFVTVNRHATHVLGLSLCPCAWVKLR